MQKYFWRIEAIRIQSPMGAISQMCAGLTHNVQGDRLRKISASIPKVTIVTGDEDHLVDPSNSKHLKDHMPEADYVVWEGTGHAIHMQWPDRYNALLEQTVKAGRERAEREAANSSA